MRGKTGPPQSSAGIGTQLTWLGEALQGQVNIVAFPLSRNEEVKNLEVLTVDEQRTS